jgi:hypothetical protein
MLYPSGNSRTQPGVDMPLTTSWEAQVDDVPERRAPSPRMMSP